MTTYQRESPDPQYPPHRGSLSGALPPQAAPGQRRGSSFQGYSGTPSYDPYTQQQPGLTPEAAARRYSVPYGPSQPAVSPYVQSPQFDQRQGYFPQHPPAPTQGYPPSSYPQSQPPPQQYNAYPPAPPRLQPYPPQSAAAIDDGVTFDQSAYMHPSSATRGSRPRAYSSSSQRSHHSHSGSDGYERDAYDRDSYDRERYERRASTGAPRRDRERSRRSSHATYVDEYGEKHYHKKDRRPTYGDSLMFAWDKAVDFLSGKRY